MRNVLIITEANERVATGHLYESAELAKHLIPEGWNVDVLVNDDAETALKDMLPCRIEYHEDVEKGYGVISKTVEEGEYSVVVTDLREISNEWIHRFKSKSSVPLVCIDEWGHRRLDCDVIINPMIDPYYWEYDRVEAKTYFGHEYLILPAELQEYHNREKRINPQIEKVCVSMGGVDREGTTMKILKWIMQGDVFLENLKWNIIIGAGFRYREELDALINGMYERGDFKAENIRVYRNPDNIYELFYEADIAFCAGGNTLHELACMGTPTVVIPTVPHEERNGKKYQKLGFGICTSLTTNMSDKEIEAAISEITEYSKRCIMSNNGKSISDARGLFRTVEVIEMCIHG